MFSLLVKAITHNLYWLYVLQDQHLKNEHSNRCLTATNHQLTLGKLYVVKLWSSLASLYYNSLASIYLAGWLLYTYLQYIGVILLAILSSMCGTDIDKILQWHFNSVADMVYTWEIWYSIKAVVCQRFISIWTLKDDIHVWLWQERL